MSSNAVAERSGPLPLLDQPSTSSTRRPTILVIEDSDVIRKVLTLILESEGYEVVGSAQGSSGLELANQLRPDLISLDLALGDLDGREVLHSLRSQRWSRNLPVVVVSAYVHELTVAERASATDVVVKPFDLDDLVQRLRLALEHRSEHRS
jgi:two-component system, OmpR family, KDP operon response regulator KdpE